MTVVTAFLADVWGQLLSRRLLPVAALLVAALVAVPVVLAKDPEPVAPAPAAPAPAPDAAAVAAKPVVALAADPTEGRRRRVLGARKNPFRPAPAPKPKISRARTPRTPAAAPAEKAPVTGVPSSDGSIPAAAPAPAPAPAPTRVAEPEKRRPAHAITVRFGDATADELDRIALDRLEPLPDEETPVLVFLGLGKDGRTARFMLDAGVEVEGDGTCDPDPSTCQTLELRVGDTEFLDVKDGTGAVVDQYQLDLVRISRRAAASARRAAAARAAAARAAAARTAASHDEEPVASRGVSLFGAGL